MELRIQRIAGRYRVFAPDATEPDRAGLADRRGKPVTRDTSPAAVLRQLSARDRSRQIVEYSGP